MDPTDQAAERLLDLVIALMNTRTRMTKDDIRTKVAGYDACASDAAFERMFERDKDTLRDLGVPVLTDTDPTHGDVVGYRIEADQYRLPVVEFTPAELGVLAVAAQLWRDAQLHSSAGRGLTKLKALGIREDDQLGIGLDLRVRPAGAALGPLLAAIENRRVVRFEYEAASSGKRQWRTVQPWQLLARGQGWYLIGWDVDRGESRSFRLSRLCSQVRAIGKPDAFEPPAQIDVDAALAAEPRTTAGQATVLIRTDRLPLLRARGTFLRAADDGEIYSVPYPNLTPMARQLAGYADALVVLDPPALRQAVTNRLRAVASPIARPTLATSTQPGATSTPPPEPVPATTSTPARARAPQRSRPMPETTPERLARLLALVAYLGDGEPVDVEQLAEHFAVSTEQILRDVDLLWVSGTPGYEHADLIDFSGTDRDRGLITLTNAQGMSAPLRLGSREASALLAALQSLAATGAFDQSPAVESAAHKLAEASGGAQRLPVHVALSTERAPADLATIRQAIAENRTVRMRYVNAADEISDRLVDPLHVFTNSENWLMSAWCHRSEQEKYFRLDRILQIELTDRQAAEHPSTPVPPSGFSGTRGEPVVIGICAEARWLVDELPAEQVHQHGDGSVEVVLNVADPRWLTSLVLAHGGDIEIREPAAIRDQIARTARRALEGYR